MQRVCGAARGEKDRETNGGPLDDRLDRIRRGLWREPWVAKQGREVRAEPGHGRLSGDDGGIGGSARPPVGRTSRPNAVEEGAGDGGATFVGTNTAKLQNPDGGGLGPGTTWEDLRNRGKKAGTGQQVGEASSQGTAAEGTGPTRSRTRWAELPSVEGELDGRNSHLRE
jgi:hypothetical protein